VCWGVVTRVSREQVGENPAFSRQKHCFGYETGPDSHIGECAASAMWTLGVKNTVTFLRSAADKFVTVFLADSGQCADCIV